MSGPETGLAFITEFLRDKCPDAEHVGLEDDLLDSGILRSLHFVELLYLIEERLGTELSMDEVSTEDFRTISRIKERFLAPGNPARLTHLGRPDGPSLRCRSAPVEAPLQGPPPPCEGPPGSPDLGKEAELPGADVRSQPMVEQRVRDVFASVFDVAAAELPRCLNPDTLSGWDSLRHVRIMIELEKAFGIEIDPNLMPELASGTAIVSFVESRVIEPGDRRAA